MKADYETESMINRVLFSEKKAASRPATVASSKRSQQASNRYRTAAA